MSLLENVYLLVYIYVHTCLIFISLCSFPFFSLYFLSFFSGRGTRYMIGKVVREVMRCLCIYVCMLALADPDWAKSGR